MQNSCFLVTVSSQPSFKTQLKPSLNSVLTYCAILFKTVWSCTGEYVAELSPDLVLVDVQRIQDKWPQLPNDLDAAVSYGRYVYLFKVRLCLYFEQWLYRCYDQESCTRNSQLCKFLAWNFDARFIQETFTKHGWQYTLMLYVNKLQAICLMSYKRQIQNCKNQTAYRVGQKSKPDNFCTNFVYC